MANCFQQAETVDFEEALRNSGIPADVITKILAVPDREFQELGKHVNSTVFNKVLRWHNELETQSDRDDLSKLKKSK